MRAFICEVDHHGLRRLLPEDLLPAEQPRRLARISSGRPPAFVWALVDDPDVEDLRSRVNARSHSDAFGLLLNRAVKILPRGEAVSATSSRP
jgi:hypothetical protein